ncbi:60Kd inner membrane protein-domain-containing protein [Aspergillus keveii]|uniref:60Kd inner membrane protein-domain-containing protein n=1 Tax=Aspergillus keveii TaxID=714993 RepID=A0ABR4GA40_9EURO
MYASRNLLRVAPLQQVRRFHQTRPAPFVTEVLEVSSSFIHGVHSVSHLPWALSLPLTAFLVRMGVALPLQIFTKVQARKDSDLTPVLMAWRHLYQKKAQEKAASGVPLLRSEAMRQVSKDTLQQHRTMRERWGIYRFYRPATFLQMPVWIMIMESIRGMSGNNNGLIPYLLSLVFSSTESSAPIIPVEPSLATEGALWFPDLLAGDPTGILPVAMTLSILLNVRMGWKSPTLKDISYLPRMEMARELTWRGLKFFVQVLALNVGISSYMYEMPAALMIYWITSANIATLQTFLLQRYMFPTPSLKPWKKVHIGYS